MVLEKNEECYACGQNNARGLRLRFEHTGPFTAEALTSARPEHEGWRGLMHGGVTFTLMDEAFGWCLFYEGIRAVTAKVDTKFLQPVETGASLRVRARMVADRGRLINALADVTAASDDSVVYATAVATMMRRSEGEGSMTAQEITMREMASKADANAFRTLNEEWISKWFRLEEKDIATLGDPAGSIVAHGGRVYLAVDGERVLGVAALIRFPDGSFELSKMAVRPETRGQGVGRALILYVIGQARLMGAPYVFLGSSTKLRNAVHLYESVGFRHVPPGELPEMKYDRADVFMQMKF